MNKPFNITPNQVKAVFIVAKHLEDGFLSFLFNLGFSWIERDFETLAMKIEQFGIIFIREGDPRLPKLFSGLYNIPGIFYYCIGTKDLLTTETVDPFIHNIFVNRDQWNLFDKTYKNINGILFTDILKEMK